MARDHYDLDDMKKKPSALLVYLALEQNRGNGPMGRQEIIDYIKENFGIEIQPKTVSESVAILKALSSRKPPLIHFLPQGKNGYELGRTESVFSIGETLRIIDCFSSVSAADEAWKSLETLLNQEDINTLRSVRGSLIGVKGKEPETKDEQKYFEKIGIIAHAIESKHEVIFDHVHSDANDAIIEMERDVHLSPYFLFTKNGRFYILGGRLADNSRGILGGLYVANIENIEHVKISRDDIEPWHYSYPQEHTAWRLSLFPYIGEGKFHHGYYARYLIQVTSRSILTEINSFFGQYTKIIKRQRRKHGDRFVQEFIIETRMDFKTLCMLQMRFPTSVRILNLPEVFRQNLVDRANMIVKAYSNGKQEKRQPNNLL